MCGDIMKKLVIFGFDGTIADTSPGILYCMNTTAITMGYTSVPLEKLYGVIGVSLEQGFMKLYGMKEDEIEYAMNNYSKLYSMKGEEMIMIYDGIAESLSKLKADGCRLAIVTQKNHKFVSNMLDVYSDIGGLFDSVFATDVDIEQNKTDMLRGTIEKLGAAPEDCVFIGDSYVDAIAAQEAGIDFAAALYGWGFRSKEDTEPYSCRVCIENAGDIYRAIVTL